MADQSRRADEKTVPGKVFEFLSADQTNQQTDAEISHDAGDDHRQQPAQKRRRLKSESRKPAQLPYDRSDHCRYGHDKRILHRKFLMESAKQTCRNRDSAAGNPRKDRQSLTNPDYHGTPVSGIPRKLFPVFDKTAEKNSTPMAVPATKYHRIVP